MDPVGAVEPKVTGMDAADAVVSRVKLFGPIVIVARVDAVAVGRVLNVAVVDAAVPFSVKTKLLLPLETVTVALVEVGRLLTVKIRDCEVGGLAVKVWPSRVNVGLPARLRVVELIVEPTLAVSVAPAAGPKAMFQSFEIGWPENGIGRP
jgi:hypothetical protein